MEAVIAAAATAARAIEDTAVVDTLLATRGPKVTATIVDRHIPQQRIGISIVHHRSDLEVTTALHQATEVRTVQVKDIASILAHQHSPGITFPRLHANSLGTFVLRLFYRLLPGLTSETSPS